MTTSVLAPVQLLGPLNACVKADGVDRPGAIAIIDDIVTRGSSFVGVMPHLIAAFPDVPIRCFALVRTISQGDIDSILAPIQGRIAYRHGQFHRVP